MVIFAPGERDSSMPTPRVPTSILEARGSFKKDPQRAAARENEPVVAEGIGGPPACFMPNTDGYQSSDAKRLEAIWHELVADAAPGVLNRSHRMHLESTCRLKDKERRGTAKTGDIANLNKFLTQMGMNPAAQSTVSGKKRGSADEEDSVFGRLSQKSRAARA
jgi:hypothetical protein